MSEEALPSPAPSTALLVVERGPSAVVIHAPGGFSMALPPTIAEAGEDAARVTFEFFTARIPNPNTRRAYGRAVLTFCDWCERERVALRELTAPTVSGYLNGLPTSAASVKLTASALRHWLDFLTERGVLPFNPALSVRTARLVVTEGKTPVLEREQARKLFDMLDAAAEGGDLLALRDRGMFALMLFGFVRVGALVKMLVRDFEDGGEYAALVLHEKGGKERRIACHHKAREYLRAYVAAAGFEPRAKVALFQSAPGRKPALSGKAITSGKVWDAVKRRCKAAGLPSSICNHSFRATGMTIANENGARLEDTQELAGHADARTTRLYIRKHRKLAQAAVERVQL